MRAYEESIVFVVGIVFIHAPRMLPVSQFSVVNNRFELRKKIAAWSGKTG